MTDIRMPDVSEFQTGASAPNWAGIKAMNGGAAIIRVGYGNSHLDHMFVANYTALKALGFSFMGLYHYLRADQDVASQAQAFINWVGPPSAVAPGTVFMLDLEEGSGDQSARANQWFAIVDAFYGLDLLPLNQRSWLYSYTSFITAHNLSGLFASNRRSWVAAYSSIEPAVGHTLWQSTDGLNGSGIVNWPGCGKTDSSIAHHSLAEMAAMGWDAPATIIIPPDSITIPEMTEDADMELTEDRRYKAVSFGNGAYQWISFFTDNSVQGKPSQTIRVAAWDSVSNGFSVITTVSVDVDHEKVTVALPAHCAGISLSRTDPVDTNWAPVAFNLGPTA